MKVELNSQGSEAYISNLAYIRALLIKSYVDKMSISQKEKNEILQLVLQYLKEN